MGKAHFAFTSRYRRGANVPDGDTSFRFRAASLEFQSSSYHWLVIAGARAQFKGEGTINGESGYGFMLTAIDSDHNGGGDVDRFRIKIWDADENVVYDNQVGDDDTGSDATELGGGSIRIHTPKNGKK